MSKSSIFPLVPTPHPKCVHPCWTSRQTNSKPAIVGRSLMEQIVDGYLRRARYACSPEYRLGMVDVLCLRAFGTGPLMRFEKGTVQQEAHMAGFEHGWAITLPRQKGGRQ